MADTIIHAYFAGLFDGEGCVAMYLGKRGNSRYVVTVSNTDRRPLEKAISIWGGSLTCQKAATRKYAKADVLRWHLYGRNAVQFLQDILPYTIIKTEQIQLYLEAMKLISNKSGWFRTTDESKTLAGFVGEIAQLKRANQYV